MVVPATISHYKILGELGRGGMGVVYRARDQKLKREVALKILPEKFLAEPLMKRRFLQEAQSAAALKHPSIAVVYEIDKAEGVTFIAMEFVEGRRLGEIVRNEGLSLDRSLQLALEIADGLGHAHKRGIVHRDLKPGNVMVTDEGHAKIIDFGLAKLMEPLVEAGSGLFGDASQMTESGILVGTLSYMSPEQARGERIDHRTDIFSFGTLFYEMLTGSSPFLREKAVDTLAAILRDPTPSLEESLGGGKPLAPELQHIVDRCTAKDPAERYQSMEAAASDLSSAIRRSDALRLRASSSPDAPAAQAPLPVSAGETGESATVRAKAERGRPRAFYRAAAFAPLVLAAVGLLWFALTPRDRAPLSRPDEPLVVAVGPFENLSGDAGLGWLGPGLSNLVGDKLAQSRMLITVSKPRWESIREGASGDAALHQAAVEKGIDYIVSGELLPSPRGLVLTARLSDLRRGTDDFAYSFEDLTPEQVLARADGIASLAKQGIGVPPEETVDSFAADVAVDNIAVYESYVSGLEFFQSFEYRKAEQAFRLALELAPDFAVASYRLAHLYAATGRRELARATMSAIPADARLTPRERLYVDAARALFQDDYSGAIATYKRLLAEYPYDVEGRQFLAEAYFLDYQSSEAIEELRKLGAQEPENEFVWSALGTYLILAGRPEEARAPLQRYRALAPDDPHPYTLLGDLERQRGDYPLAEKHFRDALARNPAFSLARLGLAQTIALAGRFDEASEIWSAILADGDVETEDRITAALDLAHARRAQYRFEESLLPLEELEVEIREEGIRESLSLVTRAMSAIELGRHDTAARWIDEAIERAPGAATRYWFARGQLELARGRLDEVLRTARQIREYQRQQGPEGNEIERKAAAYLEGWAALRLGDTATALARFEESTGISGYSYTLYDLGLAEALSAAGDLNRAAEVAERAASYRDPSEVRLDLALDRRRAQLLLARILAQQGESSRSRSAAQAFLGRWGGARGEALHPDLRLGRELSGEGAR
jgi:tetratricopeptide (TPR) repeat protein/tRNA A-37 threonylcarbamoyl transferase component Bud32